MTKAKVRCGKRSCGGTVWSPKVPASRLVPELGASYELKVKAKRGAAGPLKLTVTFQPC